MPTIRGTPRPADPRPADPRPEGLRAPVARSLLALAPCLALSLALCVASSACTTIETRHRDWSGYTGPGAEYFRMEDPPPIDTLPDPAEPANRALQKFNTDLLDFVVQPLARGWRAVTPDAVRTHIGKFGTNLAWPVRLFSTLFQARFRDAAVETGRFVVNSTVGLAGFFDPATTWGLTAPRPQDVGLTLGAWGWEPQAYVMLPFAGPSSDRDTVGVVGDTALDPATYLFPLSVFLKFNTLSDQVENYLHLDAILDDSYAIVRQVWNLYRSRVEPDMDFEPQDGPSIDTLEAVFLSYRDPDFPRRAERRTVTAPTTGREFPYDLWLQPLPAPIVYIVPGLGSHRESDSTTALAEMVFAHGHSAVTVSNALNREFMRDASSMELPGYAPADSRDLHRVLSAIDRDLRAEHPDRLTQRALLGLSLGAFHLLYIAAENQRGAGDADRGPVAGAAAEAGAEAEELLDFDAYVPINPPVRLSYGVEQLDSLYRAPLEWPAEGRQARTKNILLKVIELARGELRPGIELPFERIEAQYLIGLTFRLQLRDMLFESQLRHDRGVLLTPLDVRQRQPAYAEIERYSWMEYFHAFALPYLAELDPELADPAVLWARCDLHSLQRLLSACPSVRVFTNRNDFLLAPEDVAWLEQTFGADHLQFFESGGHLGNLYRPDIQAAIMNALDQQLRSAEGSLALAESGR
jgi:ABC-type transporter lipoprotein component MlaA